MSSWGMAKNLSDADITTALEGLAARGFNAVTVGLPGQAYGGDWRAVEKRRPVISTSLRSPAATPPARLGRRTLAQPGRHSITSWPKPPGSTCPSSSRSTPAPGFSGRRGRCHLRRGDGDARLRCCPATRYANYPNIVWHIGADAYWTYNNGPGSVVDSFYGGIHETEGSTHRLWLAEPGFRSTSYKQWPSAFTGTGGFRNLRLNASSAPRVRRRQRRPVRCCLSRVGRNDVPGVGRILPMLGSPHYGGAERQELRERNYATLIRGGIGINYGHEDWWSFDYSDIYDAPGTSSWTEVPTEPELYDAGRMDAARHLPCRRRRRRQRAVPQNRGRLG